MFVVCVGLCLLCVWWFGRSLLGFNSVVKFVKCLICLVLFDVY